MNQLKPLYADVDIHAHRGRYNVQFEVPSSSKLSNSDIDRILELSSWETEPNDADVYFEGGRGLRMARETPIKKSGLTLSGLYLSGEGYRKLESTKDGLMEAGEHFYPPTNNNFMQTIPDKSVMATMVYNPKKRRYESKRDAYRAMGAYTTEEMQKKIDKTTEIDNAHIEGIITPHIEGYGRYLDDSLKDEKGSPLGFIVFPIPNERLERAHVALNEQLYGCLIGSGTLPKTIANLMQSLRKLHDGGYVHLQPHPSNFYDIDNKIYMLDWFSMEQLPKNHPANNRFMRVLDVWIPFKHVQISFRRILAEMGTEPHPTDGLKSILYSYINQPSAREKIIDFDLEELVGIKTNKSEIEIPIESALKETANLLYRCGIPQEELGK